MSEANETGKSSIPVERIVICSVESDGCCGCGNPLSASGRCEECIGADSRNPFLACRKCLLGEYRSKPTASWMNRWKCDKCGHCCSK